MGAITDLSDIINRVTSGSGGNPQNIFFYKDGRLGTAAAVNTVAGRLTSLWQFNGTPCASGSIPASGSPVNPDNQSQGSLGQFAPSGSGVQQWLLGCIASSLNAGTLYIYDRLQHNTGLDGTVTTAQIVGGTLTRNPSGSGNQIWVEIYTQIGASATIISASYTNQAGVANRNTQPVSIGAANFREVNRFLQMPLQSGDTGVQSVQNVKLNATTGTAGNFGIVIAKPILEIPMGLGGVGSVRDTISGLPSIPEILPSASIALYWMASVTTPPNIFGSIHLIDK